MNCTDLAEVGDYIETGSASLCIRNGQLYKAVNTLSVCLSRYCGSKTAPATTHVLWPIFSFNLCTQFYRQALIYRHGTYNTER